MSRWDKNEKAIRPTDVEWCEDDSVYVVTHFHEEFENVLVQLKCETPDAVVEVVTDLANRRSMPSSENRIQSAKGA